MSLNFKSLYIYLGHDIFDKLNSVNGDVIFLGNSEFSFK